MEEHFLKEALVMLDAAGDDTHQIVAFAAHGEAFEDFGMPANGLFERFQVIFIMAADSQVRRARTRP